MSALRMPGFVSAGSPLPAVPSIFPFTGSYNAYNCGGPVQVVPHQSLPSSVSPTVMRVPQAFVHLISNQPSTSFAASLSPTHSIMHGSRDVVCSGPSSHPSPLLNSTREIIDDPSSRESPILVPAQVGVLAGFASPALFTNTDSFLREDLSSSSLNLDDSQPGVNAQSDLGFPSSFANDDLAPTDCTSCGHEKGTSSSGVPNLHPMMTRVVTRKCNRKRSSMNAAGGGHYTKVTGSKLEASSRGKQGECEAIIG
ncbi:hypothetical protein V6N13_015891 [Hibiscus sabdariffa]